ncbi:MAG: protein kinase [Anaerolineae bacterium]|nr:hypothetical protein [Thermoflexales bacterium]MDW8406242.1 protein kinase [Anaerolineae bacterium]
MQPTHDQAIWDTLRRHLTSIFNGDAQTYAETTDSELSLYEWYITPHRQDGLEFHLCLVQESVPPADHAVRFDVLEPRLQVYGDPTGEGLAVAIASYTLMVTRKTPAGITHRTHNESRVLVRRAGRWQVVHVHKSPAWPAPFAPS